MIDADRDFFYQQNLMDNNGALKEQVQDLEAEMETQRWDSEKEIRLVRLEAEANEELDEVLHDASIDRERRQSNIREDHCYSLIADLERCLSESKASCAVWKVKFARERAEYAWVEAEAKWCAEVAREVALKQREDLRGQSLSLEAAKRQLASLEAERAEASAEAAAQRSRAEKAEAAAAVSEVPSDTLVKSSVLGELIGGVGMMMMGMMGMMMIMGFRVEFALRQVMDPVQEIAVLPE
jgi:hypothetical protein